MSDYFAPYGSEYEAYEAYEEMLNDCHGTVTVCGLEYDAARTMRAIDPIAYQCGFNDWLDVVQQDLDDES